MRISQKINLEPEREKANREGELIRSKERSARQANAEKQKRYRQSMKSQGYRAKLIWEKPLENGWVRVLAPIIHESSLNIVSENQEMKEVLEGISGAFIMSCEKKKIPKKVWEPVYRDIKTLLMPLGVE